MASQYSLNLKAVLDTTQVKQELQKLRTLQQQALGNNQQRGTTQNTQNLGNLNGLNSTLSKLNASIAQLNANIQKLNIFNQKQLTQTHFSRNSAMPNIALGSRSTNITNNKAFNILEDFGKFERDQQVDRFIRDGKFRQQYMKNVVGARTPALGYANAGIMGALPLYNTFNAMPAAEQALFQQQARTATFQRWYANQYSKPQTPQQQQQAATALTPDMKRMMAGMALGQGAAAFTRIGETAFGWDKETTAAVGGIGKIGAYAAAGSAAGPWGAAIGAVVGGLELIADVCTAQAENLQQALATAAERIRSAVAVDAAVTKHFTTERDELALKTKDEKYFKNVIARERSRKREAKDWISWNIGRGPNAIERWEKETERLVAMDNKYNQPRIDRRNAIADRYRENANIMVQSDARIKQAQAMLEQINAQKKAAEDAKKAEADRQKAIEEAKKQQEAAAIKSIDSSIGGERTQIRLFGEQQSNQELLKLGNADAVKAKRDQYKKGTDTARENYLYYLDKAEKATTAQEKQEAYEIAMKSKDRWNFDKSQLDMLNTALPQLLVAPLQDALSKLTPPSMENVNSLAGQGLMINRRDDYAREQVMEDYQREQTELQRQIKDILQQDEHGSTESIIW